MNIIKNIRILQDITTADALSRLEAGAQLYQRHSRIEFKVLSVIEDIVTIRAVQSKSPAGNYLNQKELIKRTKDLFEPVLPDYVVVVRAIPYKPSPVDKVDVDWIHYHMNRYSLSLKTMVMETGIDKTSLSAILNRHVNLSQSMKAMFYNFFKSYAIELLVKTLCTESNRQTSIGKMISRDFLDMLVKLSPYHVSITEDDSNYIIKIAKAGEGH